MPWPRRIKEAFHLETVMRLIFSVIAGCLFTTAAFAAEPVAGEQLFILPPQGWVVGYHDSKGNVDVTELLPPGQTLKDWSDMLTGADDQRPAGQGAAGCVEGPVGNHPQRLRGHRRRTIEPGRGKWL